VFCPNCGQENADGARYCETCGTDLSKYITPTPVATPGPQTGPSVTPDVKYAGFWLRFVAWIIDSVLLGIVVSIFSLPFTLSLRDANLERALWSSFTPPLISFVVQWLYYALMEASSTQGTLGKMVVGIIVTDSAGNRVSFGRATGRYFGKFLSSLILLIGHIMIAFTEKKQGLHDILASTLVVKK
jgi:uncharacterized RDD family membrane protein YckC